MFKKPGGSFVSSFSSQSARKPSPQTSRSPGENSVEENLSEVIKKSTSVSSSPSSLSPRMSARFQLINLSTRQRADLLDKTRWANDFLWEDLETLAKHMECYRVARHTTVFEQGDYELFMGFILEGRVDILKEDSNHKVHVLATIEKEKTLGEMALIDGQPRSASAVTTEDSTMMLLTKESYDRMCAENPKVWGMLLLKICKLMSQRLRETSGELIDFLRQD